MYAKLTKRDFEILRALVRVQLATTRSLQDAFFKTLRLARRRLATLRSHGLLCNHSKGLPGDFAASGGQYWRVTEAGLQMFAKHFPEERIPDNLISRTQRASLRCFEHRDEMTNLYLRLIASQDLNADEMCDRADIVDWRGEYEVVLDYQALDGARYVPRKIVPDATLSTQEARYFIEVDRSTESRKRCRRILLAYASAVTASSFVEQFPDERPPAVIYVTKSRSRAQGLQEVIESLGDLPFRAVALPSDEATAWLSRAVSQEPAEVPMSRHADRLRGALRRLYSEYRQDLSTRQSRGELVEDSPALAETYELLQTLETRSP